MSQVEIILDTVSKDGARITTVMLRLHRFVHAEFMTHRVFSRNASSSRAVPISRMNKQIRQDPAIPLTWGANQKGMQPGESLKGWRRKMARAVWGTHRQFSLLCSGFLGWLGLHKQYANRLTEAHQYIEVLVTATDWDNFFELRTSEMAQLEIRRVAFELQTAMEHSVPRRSEFHYPLLQYPLHPDTSPKDLEYMRLLSAGRCASWSYRTVGTHFPDTYKSVALAKRLLVDKHMSPFEHQAHAKPGRHANLNGFINFRTMLEQE